MKISFNWLKQYIDTDLKVEEIGKILTDTGLEVESIEKIEAVKGGLKGVVVAEVISCEKHENADKLKVTIVDTGKEKLQVVCGAPNVVSGQKVLLATVGSVLYPDPENELKIKVSNIRGVESNGMLCAEDELGLGQSHDGILVLPQDTKLGLEASKYFDLENDFEIEIGLTPNRADAMGHIGVARDIIAYMNFHHDGGMKLKWPDISSFKVDNNDLEIPISILDTEGCTRYCGLSIKNVKIEPSPAWLQKRLRAVGLSPINNVVDVTNFVMRELGTPLHAFDLNQMENKIVVQKAENGAVFTTLDGVERKLSENDMMITDGNKNLCIAGIFGGKDAGISENTTKVFLESAVFDSVRIRKTAKSFGLNTDASFRYERGVDKDLTMYALKRAALLIKEIAGGEISMEPKDVVLEAKPELNKPFINLRFDKCNKLIGNEITAAQITDILKNLDFEIKETHNDRLVLMAPAYRVDVTREVDVIEEILRIYGFNNIVLPEKLNTSITLSSKPNLEKIQNEISNMLVAKGFYEMLNNSLTNSKHVEKLGKDALKAEENVEMLNALSLELNVLRQTLIFPGLQIIQYNQNRQNSDLKFFEFGKIYKKIEGKYFENKRLLILLTGNKKSENWNYSNEENTIFTLKGIIDSIISKLGLSTISQYIPTQENILIHENSIQILKNKVGNFGLISDEQKKYFGIKRDVFVADLDWDALCDSLKFAKTKYSEIPKTFAVRRDFSLLLDKSVKFEEIVAIGKAQDKKILKEIDLFDVYEGKNLDSGKKSYAVSFIFQDDHQTLKDEQVDGVMEKIRTELAKQLKAELRN